MDAAKLDVLLGAAVSIAFIHTLIGVDHFLPFIVLGRAQSWTLRKVLTITALCGVGHVLSSVVLGFVGIGVGAAIGHLTWLEGVRGSLAAWLLIIFGTTYAVWAAWRALRGRPHAHPHAHADGTLHDHGHDHTGEHAHPHGNPTRIVTFWSLFVIFVLGPCEPLIPLVMAPAAENGWGAVALVSGVFGAVTIGTMVAATALGWYGLSLTSTPWLERWSHTLAGATIAVSGVAIQLLGI